MNLKRILPIALITLLGLVKLTNAQTILDETRQIALDDFKFQIIGDSVFFEGVITNKTDRDFSSTRYRVVLEIHDDDGTVVRDETASLDLGPKQKDKFGGYLRALTVEKYKEFKKKYDKGNKKNLSIYLETSSRPRAPKVHFLKRGVNAAKIAEEAAKAAAAALKEREAARMADFMAKNRSQAEKNVAANRSYPIRTWTDNTGKHKFQGKFKAYNGKGTVLLVTPAGKEIPVKASKLSRSDINYFKNCIKETEEEVEKELLKLSKEKSK